MEFDYTINYVQGKLNHVADAMSRINGKESEILEVANLVPMIGNIKG